MDGWTNGQRDGLTDRQIDGWTDDERCEANKSNVVKDLEVKKIKE